MNKRIAFTKGQKTGLFLFFMILLISSYSIQIIKGVERIHSTHIISNLNNYEKKDIGDIAYNYKENDTEYMEEVIDKTRKMVKEVNEEFHLETTRPFEVVIYPNSMEMNDGLRLSSGEKTLGAYYGGNVFLLSPVQVAGGDSPLENIILHEYTHLLLEEKTQGNHPIWFTEGVALYYEYVITGYEWGEKDKSSLVPYTIEQLNKQFYELEAISAYRSSFLRVKFMAEKYGEESILAIIGELGQNKKYNQAIKKVIGKKDKEVENEFNLWYPSTIYGKL